MFVSVSSVTTSPRSFPPYSRDVRGSDLLLSPVSRWFPDLNMSYLRRSRLLYVTVCTYRGVFCWGGACEQCKTKFFILAGRKYVLLVGKVLTKLILPSGKDLYYRIPASAPPIVNYICWFLDLPTGSLIVTKTVSEFTVDMVVITFW